MRASSRRALPSSVPPPAIPSGGALHLSEISPPSHPSVQSRECEVGERWNLDHDGDDNPADNVTSAEEAHVLETATVPEEKLADGGQTRPPEVRGPKGGKPRIHAGCPKLITFVSGGLINRAKSFPLPNRRMWTWSGEWDCRCLWTRFRNLKREAIICFSGGAGWKSPCRSAFAFLPVTGVDGRWTNGASTRMARSSVLSTGAIMLRVREGGLRLRCRDLSDLRAGRVSGPSCGRLKSPMEWVACAHRSRSCWRKTG